MTENGNVGIDFAWFRSQIVDVLGPRWLEVAPRENGIFHVDVDDRWRAFGETKATLVSQSRLLYVFARAHALSGDAAYLEAIERGAAFLIAHFRDRERGGWFWQVDGEGRVTDDTKDCYGHAFVVFGLSHAYMATGNPEHLAGARDANETVHTRFVDRHGGLVRRMARDFEDRDPGKRSQDAMMHFTEALLAQAEIAGESEALAQAGHWIEFLFSRMEAAGDDMLAEDYTLDWDIVRLPDGAPSISAGHLPEWAFLLSNAAEKGLDARYVDLGRMQLDAAWRIGWDREYGGLGRTGRITDRGEMVKGWWDQCETIRALGHYLILRGGEEYRGRFGEAVDYVKRVFIDPETGGWYGDVNRQGTPTNRNFGCIYKVDYHTVAMLSEIARLGCR